LSPFTFWNDVFINIPIAYLSAAIAARFLALDFLYLVLVFYWATNFVGIFMMYVSGKSLLSDKKKLVRELSIFLVTIGVYSLILIALNKMGVLRPV
jgi:hypothetical protein